MYTVHSLIKKYRNKGLKNVSAKTTTGVGMVQCFSNTFLSTWKNSWWKNFKTLWLHFYHPYIWQNFLYLLTLQATTYNMLQRHWVPKLLHYSLKLRHETWGSYGLHVTALSRCSCPSTHKKLRLSETLAFGHSFLKCTCLGVLHYTTNRIFTTLSSLHVHYHA